MSECHRPTGVVEIRTAGLDDLPAVAELARFIWRRVYPGIITPAQIEYMLDWRYRPDDMARAVAAGQIVYEQLSVGGEFLAFAGHGPAESPDEWKLFQLYVHPDWQSRGLGRTLLQHVENIARSNGKASLVLTVNKGNARAIRTYERSGFAVRESAVFDIGGGFVMDDFVMVKTLRHP